jgi:predicted AAA+ superfamily ATPase
MRKHYDRLIETHLRDLLAVLPALSVEGLKGVGKTVSASRVASTIFELDNPQDRLLISNNMSAIATSKPPVLIDEWQKTPEVWDFVRREVDRHFEEGKFLLSGSISAKNLNTHSGAGRIVKLQMYPLSLQERAVDEPCVSLGDLLSQNEPFSAAVEGETSVEFARYMEELVLSGLPAIRSRTGPALSLMLESYLENLLTHDFEQEGIRVKQPEVLFRWLRSYAAAIATTAAYDKILDSATSGESAKPVAKTTIAYRQALARLFLVDELPAWLDGEDYYSQIKKTPKHYLADPAFAIHLLGIKMDALLGKNNKRVVKTKFDERYGNIIGRLFEALIHQSLKVYTSVNNAKLSYFHTLNGSREIDFIITTANETIAIEVKTAPFVNSGDVRHLLWLKNTMKDRLSDAIIITTGKLAYRRPDGIAVIPAALLGA